MCRLSLALVFAASSIFAQAVPIQVRGPLVVASVHLNGQGPFRMIVDTGATSCSVLPKVATRLRLNPEYRVLDLTPAGKRLIPGSRSVEVALGARTEQNVEFLWQESPADVDGVLGQSLLSRFDYTLDYTSRRLILDSTGPDASDHAGKRIGFSTVAGRMLLPAMNPTEGSMGLILDSAASNVLLWRTADYRTLQRPASLIAMSGRRGVSLIHIPLLVVGDQVLQRLDAVAAPPADEGRLEDGLLPAGLFRSIYVSNSESYVKLRR